MLLTPQDHARIADAVAVAEAGTRGEIVCAVIEDAAASYAEVPLAWAAALSLVLPALPLATISALQHLGVVLPAWTNPLLAAHFDLVTTVTGYVLVQCLLFAVVLAVASVPAIRRRLTPASISRAHVHARALEQFFARNLHQTIGQTGVLIFVAVRDRRVELLADSGINARVGKEAWGGIIDELTRGVRAGRLVDGLVAAIDGTGKLLRTYVPANGENPDELPNRAVEVPPR
jgi:putative membrane protein